MNTSLFVGLCYDARLDVELGERSTRVLTSHGSTIADISEVVRTAYIIDTWGILSSDAAAAMEYATEYALTPIEERE